MENKSTIFVHLFHENQQTPEISIPWEETRHGYVHFLESLETAFHINFMGRLSIFRKLCKCLMIILLICSR